MCLLKRTFGRRYPQQIEDFGKFLLRDVGKNGIKRIDGIERINFDNGSYKLN